MHSAMIKSVSRGTVKNKELFEKYQKTHAKAAREQIVLKYLDLVKFISRRFLYRGEPLDDLIQVGTLGLMKAIERYDVKMGIEFTTFATPTVIGELRHYFRDDSHVLKIPRRLEELARTMKSHINEFVQKEGHSPTVKQISRELHVAEAEVVEAIEALENFSLLSLDTPLSDKNQESGGNSLITTLTGSDYQIEKAADYETLKLAMQRLSKREQRILHMRFYQNLQQWEIAEKLNISQVHVSRLLIHSLRRVKGTLVRQAKEDGVY
jgi:RNA polymerase sigma-B factor